MATTSEKKSVTKKTVTKKAAPKKKVAKKSTNKKASTVKKKASSAKKTVKKKVVKKTKKTESTLIEITPEEQWRMIAVAAYLKAEKRGFTPGGEAQDWIEAEKEVSALFSKK